MALVDISRSLSPATAVWPGDQEVKWTWTKRLGEDESSVNLGALRLSTHAGSHVDAPFHVSEEGGTTDELSLSPFVGPARVVTAEGTSSIRPEHVGEISEERILFKTEASRLPDDEWPDSITPVDPKTVRHLAARGVTLIGTDAPSVDPLDSTSLPAHHALIDTGLLNLEGLCLENVPPGAYYLMALPLKIPEADAAPVRAVLCTEPPR